MKNTLNKDFFLFSSTISSTLTVRKIYLTSPSGAFDARVSTEITLEYPSFFCFPDLTISSTDDDWGDSLRSLLILYTLVREEILKSGKREREMRENFGKLSMSDKRTERAFESFPSFPESKVELVLRERRERESTRGDSMLFGGRCHDDLHHKNYSSVL